MMYRDISIPRSCDLQSLLSASFFEVFDLLTSTSLGRFGLIFILSLTITDLPCYGCYFSFAAAQLRYSSRLLLHDCVY